MLQTETEIIKEMITLKMKNKRIMAKTFKIEKTDELKY